MNEIKFIIEGRRLIKCHDGNDLRNTHITIPYDVERIGRDAFHKSSLESINIHDRVTEIEENAFESCHSLQSINVSNNNPNYASLDGVLYDNFNKLIRVPVAKKIAKFQIPSNITSIGDSAFADCKSLQSIDIPNSVTSIGERAFADCKSLQSIDIPNSVTSIGERAFNGCSALQKIDIPNSITSIGDSAFAFCSSLQSIDIPNSVTSIGYSAFWRCSSLQSIDIPNSVTSIENCAFADCSSLQSINIPNSITSIGDSAFAFCSSLQSIDIPNSVTSIGNSAFAVCSSLQSINIPNSVTSIGDSAFFGCSSLQSINVSNNNPSYMSLDGLLYDKELKKFICFPSRNGITEYDIPQSVTTIGERAFFMCKTLQSIKIPKSVTRIEKSAFSWGTELQSIHIQIIDIENAEIDNYAFEGVDKSNSVLYIPEGTEPAYKNHPVFGKFKNIEIEKQN